MAVPSTAVAVSVVALASVLFGCTATTPQARATANTSQSAEPSGPSATETAAPSPSGPATVGASASPGPGRPLVSPSPRPAPAASSARIPDYVTHGSRSRKWIALTFDADMYPWMYARRASVPEFDERIVDLLERTGTPATIFLNGLWAKAYPDLVRRLAADPQIELANHSWDHAGWTSSCVNTTPIEAPMTKSREVTAAAAIVRQLSGGKPQFFRFPGGCHSSGDPRLVRSLGEYSVGWECYFGDTFLWSAQRQVASVKGGCTSGSIVITHINGAPYHPNVYEALRVLIPWWKGHGWTVVNVGTMLGRPTPGPAGAGG